MSSPERVGTCWLGPWLPDGSGFLVRSNADREFQGLAVMNAENGQLSWLDSPDWDVEEAVLSADGQILVWTVNVEGATRLRARDMASGEDLKVPQLPLGEGWALNVSADGRRVALLFTSSTRPWNVLLVELATGEVRLLTDIRVDADGAQLVEPALIRFTASDGVSVPAYVYRPTGVKGPVPVVMSLHGGFSRRENDQKASADSAEFLLARLLVDPGKQH